MRLNFMTNSFIFGRMNRDNALKTFLHVPSKVKTSHMRLDFAGNSFILDT